MVSETKNKLNKLFNSTVIEWIARFSIERFWFIFWQYERPTNSQSSLVSKLLGLISLLRNFRVILNQKHPKSKMYLEEPTCPSST